MDRLLKLLFVIAMLALPALAQQAPMMGPEAMGPEAALLNAATQTTSDGRMATAVEIAILLTILSLLPAILVTVTSFTRIVIVLSFVRRAMGVNELPPNPVIIGLALFLTSFVMAPVAERIWEKAYIPYKEQQLSGEQAGEAAWVELRGFLVANTRQSEIDLFVDMAKLPPLTEEDIASGQERELPMRVVVPAFVLSELKTAFQMGFLLFLPFLVIDLVVSSVLLSMGMFMLPPVMISTPFKILVFVLVDGWHLVCESLVTSFHVT
jgi:flagellar biosynthetic protein FliP